ACSHGEYVHSVIVSVSDVEMPLKHIGEFAPLFLTLVQERQCPECFRIFSPQVEDPLPTFNRFLNLTQMIGRKMSALRPDICLSRVSRRHFEFSLVNNIQLLPL